MMDTNSGNFLFDIWLRRPVLSSVLAFLPLLIMAPGIHRVAAGMPDHSWAAALVFVAVPSSSALTFLIYRKKVHRIPPGQMMALLWSWGNLPLLFAIVLVLFGAATWSFWVAVIAVGVHLGWMAWMAPKIGAARTESDPTT
ncbi:hypothetical protein GCM10023085_24650 [Actinomadura viridis]|uniref:Uncharacterized protein n=1 Tax=Actinomadura viridis TaxID=58110 RepID=A0A931DLI5_9ACTN|nr:hypothetical protein [Actinomadura viridis]MBG6088838.1 hypothetical protein [Actinomadura viridis]